MTMPNEFQSDVFLSHSAKDKAVVRPLVERLLKVGMRNDSQPSTINPQPLAVRRRQWKQPWKT
jgi:hypothetical protein